MVELIIKDNGYKISNNVDDLSCAVLAQGLAKIYSIKVKYRNYRLVSNDVDFYWGPTDSHGSNTLLISCEGTQLNIVENSTCQLVVEYLNKYENQSTKEIEELIIKAQDDSKTQLESEIEDLKVEKEKLLEQISIMKQIEEKKEELKLLLTKLND